jgi:hypothetical protein
VGWKVVERDGNLRGGGGGLAEIEGCRPLIGTLPVTEDRIEVQHPVKAPRGPNRRIDRCLPW